MNQAQMLQAFKAFDKKLSQKANLLLGGGGAMVLAYGFPLATNDLDAVFYKCDITEGDVFNEIQAVAKELNLPRDWLNTYFGTFLYSLPQDYHTRLKPVYQGKNLIVNSLGLEDLLILKCFAGREKDVGHSRALIKKGANVEFVKSHIEKLFDKKIPKSSEAIDFLEDLIESSPSA